MLQSQKQSRCRNTKTLQFNAKEELQKKIKTTAASLSKIKVRHMLTLAFRNDIKDYGPKWPCARPTVFIFLALVFEFPLSLLFATFFSICRLIGFVGFFSLRAVL